jgi:phosphoribosylanthranilate isomerase
MKIKVCGLKDPGNINAVAGLGPDYMGFICYGHSPRFIGNMPAEVLNNIPAPVYRTAVFVDETKANINTLVDNYGFNAIQLHGKESPEFADALRNKVTVIKAFGLDNNFDFDQLSAYAGKVDYLLFDTKTSIHGGSGQTFNWNILDKYKLNIPFFLSGGLSLDNLETLTKITHPQFYGVDLNSRFETAPGMKDIEKLKQAFNLLKQFTANEIRS